MSSCEGPNGFGTVEIKKEGTSIPYDTKDGGPPYKGPPYSYVERRIPDELVHHAHKLLDDLLMGNGYEKDF